MCVFFWSDVTKTKIKNTFGMEKKKDAIEHVASNGEKKMLAERGKRKQ